MKIRVITDGKINFEEGCNVNLVSKEYYAGNKEKAVVVRRCNGDIEIEINTLEKIQ